jgi:hypothetical protein
MQPTRDARTARRKLAEKGITSATVLTGPTTITIDLAAFDEMLVRALSGQYIGTVFGAGGGVVEIHVDRDLGHYPQHGAEVWAIK